MHSRRHLHKHEARFCRTRTCLMNKFQVSLRFGSARLNLLQFKYGPALCVPSPPPMVCPPHPPHDVLANSHRDQPCQGRHPRNCRRFWSRKASILVTVVTFGPSCCRRASNVPTVTGIGVVLIAILRTVLTFDPSCCRRASDVSTDYKCIIFPPSELSSLLAPYVFVALQMYRQINNHRYKPSIEP